MARPTHLLIHRFVPGTGPAEDSDEHGEEMRAWQDLDAELHADGTLVEGWALTESTVHLGALAEHDADAADAETAEDRSIIFAVHAVAVEDEAAAHAVAERMPHLQHGSTEIRPIMGS
ncbi:YciI family protein [Nesterenkonia sp. F]|uniref:YciI family protein n=1 Tax=Nesterenkonia sp. F TaxID=795955 RepID=UPI000255D318|nr:YciI family protein [Nesterenkonia sp. F]